jgi:hypothetical protein
MHYGIFRIRPIKNGLAAHSLSLPLDRWSAPAYLRYRHRLAASQIAWSVASVGILLHWLKCVFRGYTHRRSCRTVRPFVRLDFDPVRYAELGISLPG